MIDSVYSFLQDIALQKENPRKLKLWNVFFWNKHFKYSHTFVWCIWNIDSSFLKISEIQCKNCTKNFWFWLERYKNQTPKRRICKKLWNESYIRKGKYTLRIKSAHWFIISLCCFLENAFLCFFHIWNKSVCKFNCFLMCTHMQQKIMLTNFNRWQFNFASINLYY